jgi:uncharacterized protein GlcG (DUF336 family)
MSLGLDDARSIVTAAGRAAAEAGFAPLAIVVLDSGGHVKLCERADGASNLRVEVAYGKAYGAIGLGIGSRALLARAEQQPFFVQAVNGLFGGRLVPVPGGVHVRDGDSRLLGVVGVSGDNSDNDEAAAVAGIRVAGFVADAG